VCLIGTALWKADIIGCDSCLYSDCYADSPDTTISLTSLSRVNVFMVLLVVSFSILIPLISVVKPIDFWSKCDRVYGYVLLKIQWLQYILTLLQDAVSMYCISIIIPMSQQHIRRVGIEFLNETIC
jgi:hypothetical protein